MKVQNALRPEHLSSKKRAAKAIAFFDQRDYILPEDIKEVADDVLNLRILLNCEADGVSTHDIGEMILNKVRITQ